MGAGSSKPGEGGGGGAAATSSKHVFASETPVQFSQEIVDALQASAETNSTRAKTLELHIQRRVADELDKIQKRESDTLNNLRRRLKEEADHLDSQPPTDKSSTDSKPEPKSPSVKDRLANLLDIPSLSAKDLLPSSITPSSSSSKDTDKESTTKSVQAEIEKLKHQLDSRKKIKEVPRSVEQAREKLVGCLRVNDRRPLDCWKEVEGFKAEVRRLEGEFVEGVL